VPPAIVREGLAWFLERADGTDPAWPAPCLACLIPLRSEHPAPPRGQPTSWPPRLFRHRPYRVAHVHLGRRSRRLARDQRL